MCIYAKESRRTRHKIFSQKRLEKQCEIFGCVLSPRRKLREFLAVLLRTRKSRALLHSIFHFRLLLLAPPWNKFHNLRYCWCFSQAHFPTLNWARWIMLQKIPLGSSLELSIRFAKYFRRFLEYFFCYFHSQVCGIYLWFYENLVTYS